MIAEGRAASAEIGSIITRRALAAIQRRATTADRGGRSALCQARGIRGRRAGMAQYGSYRMAA
jgi:hypothetical protein